MGPYSDTESKNFIRVHVTDVILKLYVYSSYPEAILPCKCSYFYKKPILKRAVDVICFEVYTALEYLDRQEQEFNFLGHVFYMSLPNSIQMRLMLSKINLVADSRRVADMLIMC